jgi:hypothetical protein
VSGLGQVVYHGLALLAMLAHLLVVGLLVLVVLKLSSPPEAAFATLVLKTLIGVVWLGVGLAGIMVWRAHRWSVVSIPFVSAVPIWLLTVAGGNSLGWTLPLGY